MSSIGIILSSVRDERNGEKIASWVFSELKKYKGNLEFELIDLKEVNLPSMNEPVPPRAGSDYKYNHTKKWSKIVKKYDGFIILTPEYNHGYPGSLKNALDYLYNEWAGKPVGLVGYGGSGATYSRKYLKDVFSIIELVPMEEEISISNIWKAFDDKGHIKTEYIKGNISTLVLQIEKFLNKIKKT